MCSHQLSPPVTTHGYYVIRTVVPVRDCSSPGLLDFTTGLWYRFIPSTHFTVRDPLRATPCWFSPPHLFKLLDPEARAAHGGSPHSHSPAHLFFCCL